MVWCVITSDIRYIFNISPPRMLQMFHRHVADDMVAHYIYYDVVDGDCADAAGADAAAAAAYDVHAQPRREHIYECPSKGRSLI